VNISRLKLRSENFDYDDDDNDDNNNNNNKFNCKKLSDRLCGIVVRVSGYRYRGPGFDSRRYQIF
jgi:hypothetical protein